MADSTRMTPMQRALGTLMSALSEQCWAAGWMRNAEFHIWFRIAVRPMQWGMASVQEIGEDLAAIAAVARAADSWIVWDDEIYGPVAIPLTDWEARFAVWVDEHRDYLAELDAWADENEPARRQDVRPSPLPAGREHGPCGTCLHPPGDHYDDRDTCVIGRCRCQAYVDGGDDAIERWIDMRVEDWHLGDDTRPLHEFLHLTSEEWGDFLSDRRTAHRLAWSRRDG